MHAYVLACLKYKAFEKRTVLVALAGQLVQCVPAQCWKAARAAWRASLLPARKE